MSDNKPAKNAEKPEAEKPDPLAAGAQELPDPVVKPARPPVVFRAIDRFHAITYARKAFQVPHELKDRVVHALESIMHTGPVEVSIPGKHATSGAETRWAAPVDTDPTKPDDGSFTVEPFSFVKV